MTDELDRVQTYHQRTVHHLHRFARGPGRLDWATQPRPFRRYAGAPLLPLDPVPPADGPTFEAAFAPGRIAPRPLDRGSLSRLLYDSLAISAWKRAGETTWALRVNPSSGNLHPTEGYLLCGPVPGFTDTPLVAHYAPREHALEVRARVPADAWRALTADLPAGTVLVGLSSIHWREAWKYGERAFRYCQLDAGHALAAVRLAAAGLGWRAVLLDDLGAEQVARLLGLTDFGQAEPEEPECLLAVYPGGPPPEPLRLPAGGVEAFADLDRQGRPNRLSPRHVDWPLVDEVAAATRKPPTAPFAAAPGQAHDAGPAAGPAAAGLAPGGPPLRPIVHRRRSAVAMDARGRLGREAFYGLLSRTVPRPGCAPFDLLPGPPQAHLALFVHRVEGLDPGLYLLVRDEAQAPALRAALRPDFAWQTPPGCPAGLGLYRLAGGDVRALAQGLSCRQAIAADGAFSLGMIVAFDAPLARYGAWFYRRLYWECGMVGQVLYLAAEAAGVRGTGIGCFFDEAVHEVLGLEGGAYRSLYHFTVGQPVDDPRLTTLPGYPPPEG